MYQKILTVILVICVITIGYFVYTKTFVSVPSESQILSRVLSNWKQIQIQLTPKAGESGTFNQPTKIQFITRDIFFVYYDDGLVDHISLLKYANGSFMEIQYFGVMSTFSEQSWKSLIGIYGNDSYHISNYTTGISRNGTYIDFKSLTKVPENVFVHSN